MAKILFIDPGTTDSAYVLWDGEKILEKGLEPNDIVHDRALHHLSGGDKPGGDPVTLYVEMIASYGMPVGKTTFKTVLFIGRLIELAYVLNGTPYLVFRKDIKMHHCHSMRAKDSNIIQALKDKYGEVSTKASPNPVYGGDYRNKMRKDIWQALAGATYLTESKKPFAYEWNRY